MADEENIDWVENPFGEEEAKLEIERYQKQGLGALGGAGLVVVAAVVVAAVAVVAAAGNVLKG